MGRRVAILGAGEAGVGWAARARLLGHDVVTVAGVDAAAHDAVMDRARAIFPALFDVALPLCGSIAAGSGDTVDGAGGADGANGADGADWVILSEGPGPARLMPGDIPLETGGVPVWMAPAVVGGGVPAVPEDFRADMALTEAPSETCAALMALAGGDPARAVTLLRALRGQGLAQALAAAEARFAPPAPETEIEAAAQPPVTLDRQVPPDWVDYNGHMNEARFLTAFSDATDRLLLWAGMDADCVASGHSVFTVETHIRHLGEVQIGARITVRTRVLEGAGKRLHVWHELCSGDVLCATGEQLLLHMDLRRRRVALPRADVGAYLEAMARAQGVLPLPEGLGRHVGAARVKHEKGPG